MKTPTDWEVAATACNMAGRDVEKCSALTQDILKGSGKLVDNHTVKYSLPGEAIHRLLAALDNQLPMNCMLSERNLFCAIVRPGLSQHNNIAAPYWWTAAYRIGCIHCREHTRMQVWACDLMATTAVQAGWMWEARSQPRTSSSLQAQSPLYPRASPLMARRYAAERPRMTAGCTIQHPTFNNYGVSALPLCVAWCWPSISCRLHVRASAFPAGLHQRPCAEAGVGA